MKNLKMSLKMIINAIVAVSLTVAVGAVGIYGLTSMDYAANDMYAKQAMPLSELLTATDMFQRLRVEVRTAIIYHGNSEQLKIVTGDMSDHMASFEAAMQAYKPSLASENGANLYNAISDNYYNIFKPGVLKVLEDAKQGQSQEYLIGEMGVTTAAANQIADDLIALGHARLDIMDNADKANSALGDMLLYIIIAVIIVAAVTSTAFALYLARLVTKPLHVLTGFMEKAGEQGDIMLSKEEAVMLDKYSLMKDEVGRCINFSYKFIRHLFRISRQLSSVADGNLTADVKTLSDKDTIGISVKKMTDNLNNMFSDINNATLQVYSGSKQIANGAQTLSQGSTEQAAAVEQLSNSIVEIADKTKVNAEMAGRAARLANTIKGNAEKGSRQMDEMMSAVREINQASHNINKVIKVIDDIAFQTNILALNAAVEAARAGQHGKGFAVVAEEVRNLAAKSAEAARDSGGLIANSMEKAELGARIADETSASLVEIVSGINESTQLVGDIAKSSEEQSAGISQINKGIEQVANVIQQNSAAAEESAAAAEEMSGQSEILEGLVLRFKLKENENALSASAGNKVLSMPPAPSNGGGGSFGKY